jgi:Uma2 family endonuclease
MDYGAPEGTAYGVADAYEAPLGALPLSGEWIVDDLEALPDDGRRYELFDGVLVVSPAPFRRHQRAVDALFTRLDAACPPDLEVCMSPLDFRPTLIRSFQPDLMVIRRLDVDEDEHLRRPPILAVEVVSDSTRSLDAVFKRSMYATSGIELFWLFDPSALQFTAHARDGDEYVQVAAASGNERITVDEPYPVDICPIEICPAQIVKG